MLAAEKFSSPLQIVILLLNLITHRTKCDAGRACNPSLLTISTSLRMQLEAAARTKLVAPITVMCKQCADASERFDMMTNVFLFLGPVCSMVIFSLGEELHDRLGGDFPHPFPFCGLAHGKGKRASRILPATVRRRSESTCV